MKLVGCKLSALCMLLVGACGGAPTPPAQPERTPTAQAVEDPLGERPVPSTPAAFVPKVPAVERVAHLSYWLDERHALPEVGIVLVLPFGGSDRDPARRFGLAALTAHMVQQGAGARDSVELAKAFEALGASFSVDAYTDYTAISLNVLSYNLEPAFALLADVLHRPRLTAADFAREKARLIDELAAADKDPRSVFERSVPVLHYGVNHPYGHARVGDLAGLRAARLEDVKAFSRDYLLGHLTLVGVGDVDMPTLKALVAKHVALPQQQQTHRVFVRPPPPAFEPTVWLIDQPGAAQAVIGWICNGVRAEDPRGTALWRVNNVLGGSFSSRLNQDLREERGLTYGASSRLTWTKYDGMFLASASVALDKTGEAMRALDDDIAAFAKEGPNAEETERSRLLARGELVETYESVAKTAARLARNAAVGLDADFDAQVASARDRATQQELAQRAAELFGAPARRVVVGPRAVLAPQLEAQGYKVSAPPKQ